MKSIIKAGQKFSRLTAIKFSHKKGTNQHWLFKCDCEKEKVICVSNVKNGNTKSCGCLKIEKIFKHGKCHSKTYRSWYGIKDRCLNKNCKAYKHYGGRGIKICDRWLKFINFYCDMGNAPKGLSIDRINNDGNYCPENCRWADKFQQANNTRRNHLLTYQNKTQNITQWAKELGISYFCIYQRIKKGWSIEKVLRKNV